MINLFTEDDNYLSDEPAGSSIESIIAEADLSKFAPKAQMAICKAIEG